MRIKNSIYSNHLPAPLESIPFTHPHPLAITDLTFLYNLEFSKRPCGWQLCSPWGAGGSFVPPDLSRVHSLSLLRSIVIYKQTILSFIHFPPIFIWLYRKMLYKTPEKKERIPTMYPLTSYMLYGTHIHMDTHTRMHAQRNKC